MSEGVNEILLQIENTRILELLLTRDCNSFEEKKYFIIIIIRSN